MSDDTEIERNYRRLSDRITFALELAVTQGKKEIANHLMQALNIEISETAPESGVDKRRNQHEQLEAMENALEKLNDLRNDE